MSASQPSRRENLTRFRYHTGGTVRRLDRDESCPVLFRDVGVDAMIRFLDGDLSRLCGPTSPITYLRDYRYQEPYQDHGCIGRIMILQPHQVDPWHSGLESIFIAQRQTTIDYQNMVFLPSEISFERATEIFSGAIHLNDVQDQLGQQYYMEAARETRHRLQQLQESHEHNEQFASPLRKMFQNRDPLLREKSRRWMEHFSISESDLCTAWNHLPIGRREYLEKTLPELAKVIG